MTKVGSQKTPVEVVYTRNDNSSTKLNERDDADDLYQPKTQSTMNLDITWSPNKKIVKNQGGSSINFTTWHDADDDEGEDDQDLGTQQQQKPKQKKGRKAKPSQFGKAGNKGSSAIRNFEDDGSDHDSVEDDDDDDSDDDEFAIKAKVVPSRNQQEEEDDDDDDEDEPIVYQQKPMRAGVSGFDDEPEEQYNNPSQQTNAVAATKVQANSSAP